MQIYYLFRKNLLPLLDFFITIHAHQKKKFVHFIKKSVTTQVALKLL